MVPTRIPDFTPVLAGILTNDWVINHDFVLPPDREARTGQRSMTPFTVEDLVDQLDRLQARAPIPFEVKTGEVIGILCSGGRARETLIAILMTAVLPLPGFADPSPLAILGSLGDIRRSMGIVLPEPVLNPALTARENLDFQARMNGLNERVRRKRVPEVIGLCGLDESEDATVATYTPAMVRRLEVARAILPHPEVLFLAGPTAGLDDPGHREVWDLLRRLNRDRRVTIVFTTHDLEEAEAIADRVAVVDRGEVVALDTPETLRAMLPIEEEPSPGLDDTI